MTPRAAAATFATTSISWPCARLGPAHGGCHAPRHAADGRVGGDPGGRARRRGAALQRGRVGQRREQGPRPRRERHRGLQARAEGACGERAHATRLALHEEHLARGCGPSAPGQRREEVAARVLPHEEGAEELAPAARADGLPEADRGPVRVGVDLEARDVASRDRGETDRVPVRRRRRPPEATTDPFRSTRRADSKPDSWQRVSYSFFRCASAPRSGGNGRGSAGRPEISQMPVGYAAPERMFPRVFSSHDSTHRRRSSAIPRRSRSHVRTASRSAARTPQAAPRAASARPRPQANIVQRTPRSNGPSRSGPPGDGWRSESIGLGIEVRWNRSDRRARIRP